jgi:hypothetical protein
LRAMKGDRKAKASKSRRRPAKTPSRKPRAGKATADFTPLDPEYIRAHAAARLNGRSGEEPEISHNSFCRKARTQSLVLALPRNCTSMIRNDVDAESAVDHLAWQVGGAAARGSIAVPPPPPSNPEQELNGVAALLLQSQAARLAWRRIRDVPPLRGILAAQQLQEAYRFYALQAALHERDLNFNELTDEAVCGRRHGREA